MSTALQLRTDNMDDWQIMTQQASMLVKTGFLPQAIKTPEQALAIILTGRELGIGTMAALNNIAVIQGKPTVSPQLMLALINRSGQVEDIQIAATKDGATCTIKRRGRSPHTAKFGPAEATAMGLLGKDNYKKQPATMYKWRAVAEAVRFTFSDVTLGLYTPEEMGANTDVETGELITLAPEIEPLSPAQERAIELSNQGVTVEAEPEPVRPVKPNVGPKTQDILNWMAAIGWNADDLANYIYMQFKVAVDESDAVKAINALEGAQKKTLHQMIQAEFNKGSEK